MLAVVKVQHSFTVFEQNYSKRPQYVVLWCKHREYKFQRKFMLLLSRKRKQSFFLFLSSFL